MTTARDEWPAVIPCETCRQPTPMRGTGRCDRCWEVERRLRDYLLAGGERAVQFVRDAIDDPDTAARDAALEDAERVVEKLLSEVRLMAECARIECDRRSTERRRYAAGCLSVAACRIRALRGGGGGT